MTQDEKNRIIEILKFHSGMIGTDSEECKRLISQVKQVTVTDRNLSLDQEIQNEMKRLCALIGYEVNPDTNKSREGHSVPMRDAVTKRIVDVYYSYSKLPNVVGSFFDKDRTTGISMIARSKVRFDTKDALFMHHYHNTLESEAA
jgi:hypothetical protein